MKKIFALVGILSAFAVVATAQNQQNQQNLTCRDISAGGYIAPDEVIMQTQSGYVACRVFKLLPAAAKNETDPSPAPAAAPPPAAAATPVLAAKASPAAAIGSAIKQRVVRPFQVSAGYQYDSVNFSGYGVSTSRINTNGAFIQGIVNVSRYVSVIGNFDAIYKNEPITVSDPNNPIIVNNQTVGYQTKSVPGHDYLLTYTGGVQAYPIGHRNWAPFVRTTFGAGKISALAPFTYCSPYCYTGYYRVEETGFAWQIGGGVDYRLSREGHLALRLGQFDYAQMKKYGVNTNSIKLGGGITF